MAPPPAAPSAASKTPAAKGKALANASASSGGPSKRGKRAPKGQQQQAAPPATERERPAGGGGGAAPPKLKIVVRRLPANIPEEIFWSSTAQWVNDETAGWKVFRKGKVAKADKEPTHSRAYILFKNQAALLDFHRSYDGHLFRDKAGNESVAVVEYAVYQKVPVSRPKPDPKVGSIDSDPDYISFLESLKPQPKIAVEDHVPLPVNPSEAQKQKITPLLEHLKARKAAQIASKGGQAAINAAAAAAATPSSGIPAAGAGKKTKGKDKKGVAPAAVGQAETTGQPTNGQAKGKKKKAAPTPTESGTTTPALANGAVVSKAGGRKKNTPAGEGGAPVPKASKKGRKAGETASSTHAPAGVQRQDSSADAGVPAAADLNGGPPLPGNARTKRRETRKGAAAASNGDGHVAPPQNVPGGNIVPPTAKPKITLLQREASAAAGSSASAATPPPIMLGPTGQAGSRPTAPAFVPGRPINLASSTPAAAPAQSAQEGTPTATTSTAGRGGRSGGRSRNGRGKPKAG